MCRKRGSILNAKNPEKWVHFQRKSTTDTHFVHIYGRGNGLWPVSAGLTAIQGKSGNVRDWATRVFGADQIADVTNSVGQVTRSVWRPGLTEQSEVLAALGATEAEQRAAEQTIRLLVERLDEILLYIEPSSNGLQAYSHKTRELLILACTEVESTWQYYMALADANRTRRNLTTKDFVKLHGPLFLNEFEISLRPYGSLPQLRPFVGWNPNSPTASLPWYDAYNKTKHNRSNHFDQASLFNCIAAVAANLILFCVRFGPLPLFRLGAALTPLVSHLFKMELRDCSPSSFYVPHITVPVGTRTDLICSNFQEWVQPWVINPLAI